MDRWDRFLMPVVLAVVAALALSGLILVARDGSSSTDNHAAVAAALAVIRGGRATEVEAISDGGAVWEVDVIKADGTAVDVRLDEQFGLVAILDEADDS